MAEYSIKKLDKYKWEIQKDSSRGMRVPGIIYADENLFEHAKSENTLEQVVNVAGLPGIINASFAMPDIHFGYGFPIGGVAAFDAEEGIISPGGVGFDISCGVRLLRTNIEASSIKSRLENIMRSLYSAVPKGVGSKGRIKLSKQEMHKLFTGGVPWAIKSGYGWEEDSICVEEGGCMDGANPDYVSREAYERGNDQVGSLGSGNHFLELQRVSKVYDPEAAKAMGLYIGQLTLMIHSGSRGLGHQICGDYLKVMQQTTFWRNAGISDRQLACAPLNSAEGKRYFGAMVCAINYAMVNRHCLAHWVRLAVEQVFGSSAKKLDMGLVYDVSHNIAKIEAHRINGTESKVCVHRKGATRAFGPGSAGVPEVYKDTGQPAIIPGDMGRYSFIMAGTQQAMQESFGSTCHGAGRVLSRTQAKKQINGAELQRQLLKDKGIVVLAQSLSGLAEEAPAAYKDVSEVVEVAHNAGLSRKVAMLEPLGVIKG
jgi:tRNA-splicing ligase RtcB